MDFIENLKVSLHKGFIDKEYAKSSSYTPKLLVINSKKDENILTSILEELETCNSFIFSVAFITVNGLATLKSYLLDLKRKSIQGRILTSTFLSFNPPIFFNSMYTSIKTFIAVKLLLFEQDKMQDKKGKEIPVVHMNMVMEQPIDGTLYHYIVDEIGV